MAHGVNLVNFAFSVVYMPAQKIEKAGQMRAQHTEKAANMPSQNTEKCRINAFQKY